MTTTLAQRQHEATPQPSLPDADPLHAIRHAAVQRLMCDPRTGEIDLSLSGAYELLENAWHANGDCAVPIIDGALEAALGLDMQQMLGVVEILEAAGLMNVSQAPLPRTKKGEPRAEPHSRFMVRPEVLVSYLGAHLTWPTWAEVEAYLEARDSYIVLQAGPGETMNKALTRAERALACATLDYVFARMDPEDRNAFWVGQRRDMGVLFPDRPTPVRLRALGDRAVGPAALSPIGSSEAR